jgi:hypothetical protein
MEIESPDEEDELGKELGEWEESTQVEESQEPGKVPTRN